MKYSNFIAHAVTGEEDNSFVGMKIIDNQIHFYHPDTYAFDAEEFERDDFLDLLKTISLAKTQAYDDVNAMNEHVTDGDFAILSYVWIIEDYLKNGLVTETERHCKVNQPGRVLWKETIRHQPIISNGNVIYNRMVVETRNQQESLVTEVHIFCVKKSLRLLGWMYGISADFIENKNYYEGKEGRYLEVVRRELDSTFDDNKRLRLHHMEKVIIGLDENSDDHSIVYGVDSYHYIFERMIDSVYGNENVRDYYPSFKWHLKCAGSGESMTGPTIRPDTIMRQRNSIYIIDSKYYRYGALNLASTKGLPEAASIVKQITYGSYVSTHNQSCDVYNVFILPCNIKKIGCEKEERGNEIPLYYAGYVSSDWESDKTYGKIYAVLADLKCVVKTWNRIVHDSDQKNLANLLSANM